MKKLLLVLTLITVSASAFAFRVDARVRVNGQRAEATVYNQFDRPIVCSGKLTAVDAGGRYAYGYINNTVVYPGRYVFLRANAVGYGNYFRDARANINCNWY
jgi:hypothetical protein